MNQSCVIFSVSVFQVWPSHWFRPWFFFGRDLFFTEHLTATIFTRLIVMGIQTTTPQEANKPINGKPDFPLLYLSNILGNICPPRKLGGRCPSKLDFADIFQMGWTLGMLQAGTSCGLIEPMASPSLKLAELGTAFPAEIFSVQFVPLRRKGRWS